VFDRERIHRLLERYYRMTDGDVDELDPDDRIALNKKDYWTLNMLCITLYMYELGRETPAIRCASCRRPLALTMFADLLVRPPSYAHAASAPTSTTPGGLNASMSGVRARNPSCRRTGSHGQRSARTSSTLRESS
jgi:hypothetical protein